MTDAWIHALAEELGVQPLSDEEISRLLAAARDVAHGVERRITPLAAFVLGAAVATETAQGAARAGVFDRVIAVLEERIPDGSQEDPG